MRVARADQAHLVRVVTAAFLHGQTVLPRFAHVTAVNLGRALHSAEQVSKNLIICELVVRRKLRGSFRSSF